MSGAGTIEAAEIVVGGGPGGLRAFHATFATEREAWMAAQDYLAKFPVTEYGTSLRFALRDEGGVERFDVIGSRTRGLR